MRHLELSDFKRMLLLQWERIEDQANKLKSKLKAEGVEVSFINFICAAIGSHLGSGAIVLGYMILD